MDLYSDLSEADADYYAASSSPKSKTLAQYLDATGNPTVMPDMCYEKCKLAVDAVMKVAMTDICEGAALANAIGCLEETGLAACGSSVFVNAHHGECNSNDTVRTLEDLEESEDATELIVNESRALYISPSQMQAMAKFGMKGGKYAKGVAKNVKDTKGKERAECASKKGKRFEFIKGIGDDGKNKGPAICVRWDIKIPKMGDFVLEIGWVFVVSGFGVWLSLESCANVGLTFGLPPKLRIEACLGGKIQVGTASPCPQVRGVYISGKAFMKLDLSLDFWICRISLASLEIGVESGCGWYDVEKSCWWKKGEGSRRRRWWTRRRRNTRKCHYKDACDIYIKGYVKLTILIVRGTLDFCYWVKNKVFEITLKLEAWAWKWHEAIKTTLYRTKMR
jgi:hypothetical protein